MPWTPPQHRPVGYVIKKTEDWDIIVDDLLYLKDAVDNAQATADSAYDLANQALQAAGSGGSGQPVGYWDVAGHVTNKTWSGGTVNSYGPLGRRRDSYWRCEAVGQSYTCGLFKSFNIVGVSFGTFPRSELTRIPKAVTVEYSQDGTNWNILGIVNDNTKTFVSIMNIVNGQITPVAAKYVRLTVNEFQAGQSEAYIAGMQILSADYAAGFGTQPFYFYEDGVMDLVTGKPIKLGGFAFALCLGTSYDTRVIDSSHFYVSSQTSANFSIVTIFTNPDIVATALVNSTSPVHVWVRSVANGTVNMRYTNNSSGYPVYVSVVQIGEYY